MTGVRGVGCVNEACKWPPCAGHDLKRCLPNYIFIVEAWVATHCHLPFGIFTQVSVKRS
jgi:hypothetical protein